VPETRLLALEELEPGRPRLVETAGVRVVVTRVGDAVYACGDVCAHKGGPLSEGRLSGTRLACPWHGWSYDVRTGECVFPGRGAKVPVFAVSVRNGEVWATLS
jgi:nitrite reductase/ring-hydroxylating ferredoxin subunit